MAPDGKLETQVVDLHEQMFDEILREGQTDDGLEAVLSILIGQVQRPRFNLGSGPPGRAD